MIPKIIHYCWFGRAPLPDKAKKVHRKLAQALPELYDFRMERK